MTGKRSQTFSFFWQMPSNCVPESSCWQTQLQANWRHEGLPACTCTSHAQAPILIRTFFQGFQASYKARPPLGEQKKLQSSVLSPLQFTASLFSNTIQRSKAGWTFMTIIWLHLWSPEGPTQAPLGWLCTLCLKWVGYLHRHKSVYLCV